MRRLHRAGYVHRDVSIGNFLVFFTLNEAKWLLQLTDYEYIRAISKLNKGEQVLTVMFSSYFWLSVLIIVVAGNETDKSPKTPRRWCVLTGKTGWAGTVCPW